MTGKKYALGLDFGTNSARALIADLEDGREVGTAVFPYPSGNSGIQLDDSDPNIARQNPADYIAGIEISVLGAVAAAKKNDPDFDSLRIIGIGVDTTGSSPMPVDSNGTPLAFHPEFKNNLNALVWLWKDHTGFEEAADITAVAAKMRPAYLAKVGGTYSSEWFWSKIWHGLKVDPAVYNAAASFVEICDYIPGLLTGKTAPDQLARSVCAAGHKAMFSPEWGGLPDTEFLSACDPRLAELRGRLYDMAYPSNHLFGGLTDEWAGKLGLRTGIAVAVGAFDAHMGAVGAGVREGALVKILGTSTCDIMVSPRQKGFADIPGVCGIVDGSVIPNMIGIEAGQSAVGDIFLWFVNNLAPEKYGRTVDEKFINLERQAASQKPGEHGLLALDWNNGNRTILVDVRLGGLLIGQSLHTQAHEIYRALIEATAFGALIIINRIEEYGVRVDEIINCGGLAVKNPFLMQVYADITGRPMKVSRSDLTCALGAALFGAVAAGKEAGGFETVEDAQKKMTGTNMTYTPDKDNHAVYREMYALYKTLHDAFGTRAWTGNLGAVMKDLITLREKQRRKHS